jgi:hypothetical protein
MPKTIDIESKSVPAEPAPTMAMQTVQHQAVGPALTVDQLHERLEFVRRVMRQEMREGTDYGKIPGTGDKPTLLQPGAQKLLMTFGLREQVKKEVLREFPGLPQHREYEFTVTVFPSGQEVSNGWDGVGTCSTLERKYRYRKSQRRCPKCGHQTIIAENPKFLKPGQVAGWICWKKKGGCGAAFGPKDPLISGQPDGDTENPDPADTWNTVRKMGFKRALVAAAINATNTSDLWTQDLEDKGEAEDTTPAPAAAPSPAPAPKAPGATTLVEKPRYATKETVKWMVAQLESLRALATEYFQKLAILMPNETLEDMPLQWVPITRGQLKLLLDAITDFGNGGDAQPPYEHNPLNPAAPKQTKKTTPKEPEPAASPAPSEPAPRKPAASVEAAQRRDPAWFFGVVCPIPRKGMKRNEYMQQPDTIGSLYMEMKAGDEEAQKRLWGFAKHWMPEERTVGNRTYQPTEADYVFREALDEFVEWEEKHGKDTGAVDIPNELAKAKLEDPDERQDPF